MFIASKAIRAESISTFSSKMLRLKFFVAFCAFFGSTVLATMDGDVESDNFRRLKADVGEVNEIANDFFDDKRTIMFAGKEWKTILSLRILIKIF